MPYKLRSRLRRKTAARDRRKTAARDAKSLPPPHRLDEDKSNGLVDGFINSLMQHRHEETREITEAEAAALVEDAGGVLAALQARAGKISFLMGITAADYAAEAVSPAAHARLVAGELADWKGSKPRRGGWEDEVSDNPFAPSDWDQMAAEMSWVRDIVPPEMRGRVWKTAHTHERGDKRWIHIWFVLEAGAEVIRVHKYLFDKG